MATNIDKTSIIHVDSLTDRINTLLTSYGETLALFYKSCKLSEDGKLVYNAEYAELLKYIEAALEDLLEEYGSTEVKSSVTVIYSGVGVVN